MLKNALTDRRFWLLTLALVLVVIVSRWTLPTQTAFQCVVYGGYWITLFLVVLFFRAVIPLIRARWLGANLGRFDAWVFAATLAITGLWSAHEKPGFKILQDELLLLGTSMGMHYERFAAYPERATDVQGAFQVLDRVLDKRPLLFPFLVSTVHDLTGYRPENPFYLNMVLAVGFLWLIYLVGWNAGGTRWAGVVAVLLFAGLPLMAQQATGGGFELLNMVLIAAFALLCAAYLEGPTESRLEALIFGALMLASTRYESALFLLPAAVIAFSGWCRAGRVILTWPLVLSPLFLVPILIQNRIFSGESQAWEMDSLSGVTVPFGLQYLTPNLGHALAFFFDFSGYQPSSALFAAAGLITLPFFALWIARVFREPARRQSSDLSWAVVGLGLFAVTAVYLLYFWGQFDHALIRRLSLPVHLLMAVSIVLIGRGLFKSVTAWKFAALCAFGGMLVQGIPVLAKQAYRTSYSPGVEMQIRTEFLDGLTDRNILFVDNDSFFWITHKIPASAIRQAVFRKEGLIYHLRNHSFADMYVFQGVRVNQATGVSTVETDDELGPDFELEPVLERRVQTLYLVRISRIKAIKSGGEVAARSTHLVEPVQKRRSAEELDKMRAVYLENWIKKLP